MLPAHGRLCPLLRSCTPNLPPLGTKAWLSWSRHAPQQGAQGLRCKRASRIGRAFVILAPGTPCRLSEVPPCHAVHAHCALTRTCRTHGSNGALSALATHGCAPPPNLSSSFALSDLQSEARCSAQLAGSAATSLLFAEPIVCRCAPGAAAASAPACTETRPSQLRGPGYCPLCGSPALRVVPLWTSSPVLAAGGWLGLVRQVCAGVAGSVLEPAVEAAIAA